MARAARHTPLRTCRVCRKQSPKGILERWVIQDGQLVLDTPQVLPGRGFYSCRSACSPRIHKHVKLKQKTGSR